MSNEQVTSPVATAALADGGAELRRESARLARRQLHSSLVASGVTLLTLASVAILLLILGHIVASGMRSLDLDFFTKIPRPYGEAGGGIAPAIVGSILMLAVAALIAVPIGVGTAIYLSEYARGRPAGVVRFALDLLAELPSIVVGVFIWALLVRHVTGYSGIAGSCALAVIMVPIVARSVEEILRLVPHSLREAALALGTPQWKVVVRIVIPTVLPGILTGIMLSLARAAGESAPLLLTALGNAFFSLDLAHPMAAMPLQIYGYAISPYDDWHRKAWAATMVLVAVVATLSGLVRIITRRLRNEPS
jgi:phosphate transport system permease protein